ncbi:MAG: 50S ribosomal protein L16 [Candidatus Bathyarchaeota archaeon]|nr:50S ribosomal protein L16 [Candidatus Bathyarchaeum tardum]WGM89647.1 MAG: 50S ribosomal protein L16 [Candidatus Bathyarchaeum tardum]WNZ30251.1 MAG: 50S ribosomal protein L16 [Candidatus Bathyarchaeota archaeon]
MKAHNYREVKGQAYTRKKYIRGSPMSKIVKFTMGNPSGTYKYQVQLIAEKSVQIRHNALESARIASNRVLSEKLGNNYHLKILPYPHIVLRENKMIFGAHADRLQDGMRNAFGKAISLAARVKPGQKLIIADVNDEGLQAATTALKRGGAKLPTPCRVVVKKLEA